MNEASNMMIKVQTDANEYITKCMAFFPVDPMLLIDIVHTHSIGLHKAYLIYCLPSAFFQV